MRGLLAPVPCVLDEPRATMRVVTPAETARLVAGSGASRRERAAGALHPGSAAEGKEAAEIAPSIVPVTTASTRPNRRRIEPENLSPDDIVRSMQPAPGDRRRVDPDVPSPYHASHPPGLPSGGQSPYSRRRTQSASGRSPGGSTPTTAHVDGLRLRSTILPYKGQILPPQAAWCKRINRIIVVGRIAAPVGQPNCPVAAMAMAC